MYSEVWCGAEGSPWVGLRLMRLLTEISWAGQCLQDETCLPRNYTIRETLGVSGDALILKNINFSFNFSKTLNLILLFISYVNPTVCKMKILFKRTAELSVSYWSKRTRDQFSASDWLPNPSINIEPTHPVRVNRARALNPADQYKEWEIT